MNRSALLVLAIAVRVIGESDSLAVCPIANETNAFAVVSVAVNANGNTLLNFTSCTDHVYVVYSANSLSSNTLWTAVAWMRGGQGTTLWTNYVGRIAQQCFYKILRLTQTGDYTGGGVPNGWAVDHGLDPVDATMAQADPDGDGFSNLEEYCLGTDPQNPASFPGANVSENLATNLIYVAMTGTDTSTGTASHPFHTIQRAMDVAKSNSVHNIGTKITVQPGTYRESISLLGDIGDPVAPIVLSAATNGTVVVSGADVWTNGWSLMSGSTNIYQHSWTNNWGLSPVPSGWPTVPTITRRREIVIVNGNLYSQVLSIGAMTNGTYFVDDSAQLLSIQHRARVIASNAFCEVAQRPSLLFVENNSYSYYITNFVVRGLDFRCAASPLQGLAVQIGGCDNVLVDHCTFEWNNWTGLGFPVSTHVTVRGVVANQNGATGLGDYETKNFVVDGLQTCFNNWRGAWGGFYGWAIAGAKDFAIHNAIYRDYLSVGNLTGGFWMDTDNRNILIERCVWSGNLSQGLFLEVSEGPFRVEQCVSSHNQSDFGLLANNAEKGTMTNCAFYANGTTNGAQFGSTVDWTLTVQDWETGSSYVLDLRYWTMADNVFRGLDGTQLGVNFWQDANTNFYRTLSSDINHWFNPSSNQVFKRASTTMDLGGWQSLTRQDAHSDFNDYLVTNAIIQDTYIRFDGTTNTHGSATSAIADTRTDGTGRGYVILMKCDVTNLVLPPREAELQMACTPTNGPVVFYVYRLTSDWDENATASQAKPDVALTWSAGTFSAADYDPQPVGVGIAGSGSGLNTVVEITALVQQWVSGASPNHGVVLIVQPVWDQPVIDPTFTNWKQFSLTTRESIPTNQRPILACLRR